MNRRLVLFSSLTVVIVLVGIVASIAFLWRDGDDDSQADAAGSDPVAWVAVGDAQVQSIASGGTQPNMALQPIVPLTERSISVVGVGSATAPAGMAELRFAVGASYGMGVMPPSGPESMMLAQEDLQPIVDALVDGGVPEDAIEATVLPGTMEGPSPYGGSGRVLARIDGPTTEQVASLVEAATTAINESGRLALYHVSATYEAEDCAALQQEATTAALEDAKARAGIIAGQVDVELGAVAHASEYTWYGPVSASACTPLPAPAGFYPYDPTTAYDPSQPAEARVYATLQVTYGVD